jgi:periplasmic divalent cation tolerance protein
MAGAFRVVLVTAPPKRAERLARGIVSARLAACVNVVPKVVSHYRWEGKLVRDGESLLVCKTRASLLKKLEAFVRKNHSYAVPEIIALPVVFGHKPYLDWLADSTS